MIKERGLERACVVSLEDRLAKTELDVWRRLHVTRIP